MLGDFGVNKLAPVGVQASQSPLFVHPHQARVTSHVSGKDRSQTAGRGHSGRPAFLRPSSYRSMSSILLYGPWTSLNLERHKPGSICRNRAIAERASSSRPASALLAALMRNPSWKFGKSRNTMAAEDSASS